MYSYIQIIDRDFTEKLRNYLFETILLEETGDKVTSGSRLIGSFHISEFPEISNNIEKFFPNVKICTLVRIYRQEYGSIKRHNDTSSFNNANTTCIIYLNDNYDGGNLHLELSSDRIIKIIPKTGYAVFFSKNFYHYAIEVYTPKELLILDLNIHE